MDTTTILVLVIGMFVLLSISAGVAFFMTQQKPATSIPIPTTTTDTTTTTGTGVVPAQFTESQPADITVVVNPPAATGTTNPAPDKPQPSVPDKPQPPSGVACVGSACAWWHKTPDSGTCTNNDECVSGNCDLAARKCFTPAAPPKEPRAPEPAAPVDKSIWWRKTPDTGNCTNNDECVSGNCDLTNNKCFTPVANPPPPANPPTGGQPSWWKKMPDGAQICTSNDECVNLCDVKKGTCYSAAASGGGGEGGGCGASRLSVPQSTGTATTGDSLQPGACIENGGFKMVNDRGTIRIFNGDGKMVWMKNGPTDKPLVTSSLGFGIQAGVSTDWEVPAPGLQYVSCANGVMIYGIYGRGEVFTVEGISV
jgi:hypothetical protein